MIIGVAITKETSWRGQQEEFSNVYNYDTSTEVTSEQVIDAVVTAEKGVFGSNVTFKNAKAYGPVDGTKLQNVMLKQKTLTGTGQVATGTVAAKELSIVVMYDTGRLNTRGGRIFFRKYLHVGRLQGTDEEGAKGNQPLNTTAKELVVTYANAIKNPVGVSGASLCDKQGRKLPVNTTGRILPNMHTRQFRR